MIVLAQQTPIGGGPPRHSKQPAVPAAPNYFARESRRQLLAGGLAAALAIARPPPAAAAGLEAGQLDLPSLPSISSVVEQQKAAAALRLEDAEKHFQESDLLATLKERSEANRAANRKAIADKICLRQAELGIGDCGGLRRIPGMTQRLRKEGLRAIEGGSGGSSDGGAAAASE